MGMVVSKGAVDYLLGYECPATMFSIDVKIGCMIAVNIAICKETLDIMGCFTAYNNGMTTSTPPNHA